MEKKSLWCPQSKKHCGDWYENELTREGVTKHESHFPLRGGGGSKWLHFPFFNTFPNEN